MDYLFDITDMDGKSFKWSMIGSSEEDAAVRIAKREGCTIRFGMGTYVLTRDGFVVYHMRRDREGF